MKVESTATPFGVVYTKRATRSSVSSKKSADEVTVSELANQLQTGDDVFDAERVEEIKQAIAEGRFTINAEAIADRLIESAKELITSRRH